MQISQHLSTLHLYPERKSYQQMIVSMCVNLEKSGWAAANDLSAAAEV